MGKGKKYYVVFVGRSPGIYTSWHECAPHVNNYNGSIYQGFETRSEAEFTYAHWLSLGRLTPAAAPVNHRTYVVFVGRRPGVYSNWAECRLQINGFSGAVYRAYNGWSAATLAYAQWRGRAANPCTPSSAGPNAVDGACRGGMWEGSSSAPSSKAGSSRSVITSSDEDVTASSAPNESTLDGDPTDEDDCDTNWKEGFIAGLRAALLAASFSGEYDKRMGK